MIDHKFDVYVPAVVPMYRIADLLCLGLEGGIDHWGKMVGFIEPSSMDFRHSEADIWRHIDWPLNPGGAVIIESLLDGKKRRLDIYSIKLGLARMAAYEVNHFNDFMTKNEDAKTGDVFIQYCLLDGPIGDT